MCQCRKHRPDTAEINVRDGDSNEHYDEDQKNVFYYADPRHSADAAHENKSCNKREAYDHCWRAVNTAKAGGFHDQSKPSELNLQIRD